MAKFIVRVFVFGFVTGFFIGVLLKSHLPKNAKHSTKSLHSTSTNAVNKSGSIYAKWFTKQNLQRMPTSIDTLRYGGVNYLTEAKYLSHKLKFLCLILVRKIKYVKAATMTWAKQCDHVELIRLTSDKKNKLTIRRNKNASWSLLCKALGNITDGFHWVLIINEDTFAIIENMRYLVAPLNSTNQYYLGHAITFWGTRYNSAQAGYLLSNGTLTALKMKFDTESCPTDSVFWNLEDYYLGKILASLNISISDTRDDRGLARFHGFNLQKLFSPGSTMLSKFYRHSVYPSLCCSSHSVTFQVQGFHSMFTYQYLLHKLQIFTSGIYGNQLASTPVPEDEIWKSILRQHGRSYFNITAEEYYDFWVELVNDPSIFAQQFRSGN